MTVSASLSKSTAKSRRAARHTEQLLAEGDRLEIVTLVGGAPPMSRRPTNRS